MNQILSTENKTKRIKKKNTEILDMRKIIIIFSVLIIVFALIIIGAKIYEMVKENQKDTAIVLNEPTITIEDTYLKVKYDEGLKTVTYWWNDEENIIEKNLNGSVEINTALEIPEGNYNVLYVIATGIDGSVSEVSREFTVETQEDLDKPQISWYHYEGTTKMDISVISDKGIKSLTYNWEGEEAIEINATEENQTELKITIEVKRGTNKLYVVAKDIEGNEQTKSEYIKGIMKPEFDMIIENNILKISVTHDMGFEKVIIEINNQEYIYDENNSQYSESITTLNTDYEIPANVSRIDVEVRAYTLEEPDKEYIEIKYADL